MTLGRQFRLVRSTYQSPVTGRAAARDYSLRDQDNMQHALIQVAEHSNEPVRRTGWNEQRPFREGDINADRPWNPWTNEGQQILFEEDYGSRSPGKSVLANAAMTKEARVMAMPLLAQAAYDTAAAGRGALLPSDDLSQQSSRLVQRLQGRGLVDAEAPSGIENNIGFATEPWPAPAPREERVEEEVDLAAAKKMGRSILKHTRVPKPQTVEQMRLSGLD